MRERIQTSVSGYNPPDNVRRCPLPRGGGSMWIATLAIAVDGEPELFVGADKSRERAIAKVESYLDPQCQCKHGDHRLCEVHGTTNG